MGLHFAYGWDEFKRHYRDNQAFLDLFGECNVAGAIGRAYGHFNPYHDMLSAACGVGGGTVYVEQGPHQPENMRRGGFCLHVTARYRGWAHHLYMMQDPHTARLEVVEITG